MINRKVWLTLILVGILTLASLGMAQAFTTGSSGFANNGAPEKDFSLDESNGLIMDISLPDPGTDTSLAGSGTPSAGSSIVTTNPWSGATIAVMFYDDTDNTWESGSDIIVTDDDKDDKYTNGADQVIDTNGTTGSGDYGSAADISVGAALVNGESVSPAAGGGSGNNFCLYYYDTDGSTDWSAGDDLVLDKNCGSTTDLIADLANADDDDGDTVNDDDVVLSDGGDGVVDVADGNTIVRLVSGDNVAFEDAGISSDYEDGEDVVQENYDGGTYSDGIDTKLAGTVPLAGQSLTATNPWSGASVAVFFYDDGDSIWQSGNDGIFTDDDQSTYYNGDKISSVAISNDDGTADNNDITAIKIWQENGTTAGFQSGEDTNIGSDTTADFWGQTISCGSAVAYTASSKDRMYVTVDISPSAINQRTIKGKIGTNSLLFVSTNDGPTDTAIINPYSQTIIGGGSLESIPPSSTISDPSDGAEITAGQDYTIMGDSSDTGSSSVKKVEISLDGGASWDTVTPLETTDSGFSWEYVWETPIEGSYNLKTRATDWIGNIESPGTGISVSVVTEEVTPVLTCSDYTTQEECVEEGCFWYEDSCHKEEAPVTPAPTCSDYTTQEECVEQGCYWYEGLCQKEKPTEQMSAEELKEKIKQIQLQIIDLLEQLIQLLQGQLAATQ